MEHNHGCPGSRMMQFNQSSAETAEQTGTRPSQLRQWPVQLTLVSPQAPYFQNAEVLLVADCVAYASGDFHKDHLAGHGIAIACPKMDQNQDDYRNKITSLIDDAQIKSLTVMIMEVPCCRGLVRLAQNALEQANRKIEINCKVIGIHGEVKSEGPC